MDDAFRSGFASALLEVLFTRLSGFIASEVHLILNVDESLKKLQTNMRNAQHHLNLVYQIRGTDPLRRRADEVARLCYDADDLIDDIDRKIKEQKLASWSRNPALQAVKPLKNWNIPRRINKLQKKLIEITDDLKTNLNLSQHEAPITVVDACDDQFSSNQMTLVGRDEDRSFIVNELTSLDRSDSNGVSIVGMRGLGKTALALDILNHEEIKAKFPLILRVAMEGKSFNMGNMVAKLVVVHHNNDANASNGHSWNNLLAHNNWLLLIDDVSEVSLMEWRKFRNCCSMNKGRKLLVTTLNPDVANIFQTTIHSLKQLSDEHCQELITHELNHLGNGYVVSPYEMNLLAKVSCGLPLVATFLGCAQAKRGQEKKQICDDEDLWNWRTFREEILPVLRSPFLSLEPHLKRCFVYFSLFPQGYHFEAEDLILLWIGEGLVQPHGLRLDENGWNNFNGLLERSILQSLPHTGMELIKYEIHKLTHYCAQSAGSKTYVQLGECASILDRLSVHTLHLSLSLSSSVQPQFWKEMKHLKGLRTFLSLNGSNRINQIPNDLFKIVSKLRVLSLNKTEITDLPDSISYLHHLRYLDISYTPIKKLPSTTLSKLSFLQILKLKKDPGAHALQLPTNIHDLTSLVYIDWGKSDIKKLQAMPCKIGNLTNLRTLPLFMLGDKTGYRITELKNMNHLQGSLCISNLEMVENGDEAREAMLSSKLALQRLELEWDKLKTDANAGNVIEGLKPSYKLKELQIINYGFHALPQWLSQSLPMLENLQLNHCYCIDLSPLGQLLALKTLRLEEMSELTHLDLNFGSHGCLPSLEVLELCNLAMLETWIELGAHDMLRLRRLEIMNCPKLENLPSLTHLTSLVDLQIER